MSSNDLYRKLRAKQIPELILLHGQEPFLVQRMVRAIRTAVLENERDDFNDNQFFGKECSATQIIDAALTLPVFAPKRLVTVKDAQLLPAAELDSLLSYLKNPAPETCLLLVADKVDSRRKFFQQFKKNGVVIEFKPLSERELFSYVKNYFEEQDIQITADAVALFCAMVGAGLHEVHGELEKLRTFVSPRLLVDVGDIQAVVSRGRAENIFELGNAVGRGDIENTLLLANRLIETGEAPLKILSLVVRHFRQLWKVRELQVQNRDRQEIAGVARVPFFVVEGMIAQAKRFSRQHFQQAFELFLETDLAMKSSGADAEALLESLLLRLAKRS